MNEDILLDIKEFKFFLEVNPEAQWFAPLVRGSKPKTFKFIGKWSENPWSREQVTEYINGDDLKYSGFAVLTLNQVGFDVDYHGKFIYEADKHPSNFLFNNGLDRDTLTVKTPSGGQHKYYTSKKSYGPIGNLLEVDFGNGDINAKWEKYKQTILMGGANKNIPQTAIDIRSGLGAVLYAPGSNRSDGIYRIDNTFTTILKPFSLNVGTAKSKKERIILLDDMIKDGPAGCASRNIWFRDLTYKMALKNANFEPFTYVIKKLLLLQDDKDTPAVTMDACMSMFEKAIVKQGNYPRDGIVGELCYKINSYIKANDIDVTIDWGVIEKAYSDCFMNNSHNIVTIYNKEGNTSESTLARFTKGQIPLHYGKLIKSGEISAKNLAVINAYIQDFIIAYRQVKEVVIHIRYFTDESKSVMKNNILNRYEPFHPLETGDINQEIIDEWIPLTPFITPLLRMMVAAQFVKDHKRCTVYLIGVTNSGKTVVLEMLKQHHITADVSFKALYKALGDGISGLNITKLSKSMAWVSDEEYKWSDAMFKYDNGHDISGKGKQEAFVKSQFRVVSTTNGVPQLEDAGHGLGQEYINRVSKLPTGTTDMRFTPMMKKHGSVDYREACFNYIGKTINDEIAMYQAMGKEQAAKHAATVVDEIADANPLGKSATKSGNIIEMAIDLYFDIKGIMEDASDFGDKAKLRNTYLRKDKDRFIIKSPSEFFKEWVKVYHLGNENPYNNNRQAILAELDHRDTQELLIAKRWPEVRTSVGRGKLIILRNLTETVKWIELADKNRDMKPVSISEGQAPSTEEVNANIN